MLVALIGINGVNHIFDTHWSLDEAIGAERFERWNSYSRIGLRADEPVVTWDGMPYEYTELGDGALLAEYAAMKLRPGGDVLVMGGLPGVMAAARTGARSITVVERNPTVSRRILDENDDWLGVEQAAAIDAGVEIEVVTRNERVFLAEAAGQREFDIIQISLPLGPALAPEKKGLLTVEGLAAAFGRLKPGGVLSLTFPAQTLGTLEIAAAAQKVGEAPAAGFCICGISTGWTSGATRCSCPEATGFRLWKRWGLLPRSCRVLCRGRRRRLMSVHIPRICFRPRR